MSYNWTTEDTPVDLEVFPSAAPACSGNTTLEWFPNPEPYWPPRAVIELCARCPVRQQCLERAVEDDATGFWGGTSHRQRKEWERRGRNRLPTADSATLHEPEAGSVTFYRRGCRCQECLAAQAARIRRQRAQRAQRKLEAGE